MRGSPGTNEPTTEEQISKLMDRIEQFFQTQRRQEALIDLQALQCNPAVAQAIAQSPKLNGRFNLLLKKIR